MNNIPSTSISNAPSYALAHEDWELVKVPSNPIDQDWNMVETPSSFVKGSSLEPYETFAQDKGNRFKVVTGTTIDTASSQLTLQSTNKATVPEYHQKVVDDFKTALAEKYGKQIATFAFPISIEKEALQSGLQGVAIALALTKAFEKVQEELVTANKACQKEATTLLEIAREKAVLYDPGTEERNVADAMLTLAHQQLEQIEAASQASTALITLATKKGSSNNTLPLLINATNTLRFSISSYQLALQLGLIDRGGMGASALGFTGSAVGYLFNKSATGGLIGTVIGGRLGGDTLERSIGRGLGGSIIGAAFTPAVATMMAGSLGPLAPLAPFIAPSVARSVGSFAGAQLGGQAVTAIQIGCWIARAAKNYNAKNS